MHSNEEIIQQLNSVFRKVFRNGLISVTNDLSADDISNWDSLTHMELLAEVEKTFGIRFSFEDAVSMKSAGDLIRCITKLTSK